MWRGGGGREKEKGKKQGDKHRERRERKENQIPHILYTYKYTSKHTCA